jgi:hypothetical protein
MAALLGILSENALAQVVGLGGEDKRSGGLPDLPHFAPKANRVIYLFQSGAPSQMELFDPKPQLLARRGEDLPSSVRMGQRLTGMTSGQKAFPVAPSVFKSQKYGSNGVEMSELIPTSEPLRTRSVSCARCTRRRSTTTRP